TTPGDSLRSYFTSQAGACKASQTPAAIAEPAIDAMIDRIISAETRPELVVAARALDRLIRAGRYWVPHWYKASHWIAYWDVFGRPATKPRYARGVLESWWYDRDKAPKLDRPGSRASHARLYRPAHPVHDSHDLRDHAGLLPGGAVGAGRAGGARNRAALRLRHWCNVAHLGLAERRLRFARPSAGRVAGRCRHLQVSRRPGAR